MAWSSDWKAAYDALVSIGPSPADAIGLMVDFQGEHGLETPLIYVSTAITSGGFRRDPALSGSESIPSAVARNNAACALLVEALGNQPLALLAPTNAMVPTELGKVPNWSDTHYIEFYFGWCGGLDKSAAMSYGLALAAPEIASIRAEADARERTNDERWPAYSQFAKAACVEVLAARPQRTSGSLGRSKYLLQLIDTGYSLGCQAETTMAQILGLEIITVAIGDMSGAVGDMVTQLRLIGSSVGIPVQPIEVTLKIT
jgi:hypothetical protein